MKVFVHVNGVKLRIPVPASPIDDGEPISVAWLRQEACKRYERVQRIGLGSVTSERIVGSDGSILDDEDLVEDAAEDGEQLSLTLSASLPLSGQHRVEVMAPTRLVREAEINRANHSENHNQYIAVANHVDVGQAKASESQPLGGTASVPHANVCAPSTDSWSAGAVVAQSFQAHDGGVTCVTAVAGVLATKPIDMQGHWEQESNLVAVASGGRDGLVALWDGSSGQCLGKFEPAPSSGSVRSPMRAVEIIPLHGQELTRYVTEDASTLAEVQGAEKDGAQEGLSWPRVTALVIGAGEKVHVWHGVTKQLLQTISPHNHYISSVSALASGHVVTASWDMTATVIDSHSWETCCKVPLINSACVCMSNVPETNRLVVGGLGGEASLLDIHYDITSKDRMNVRTGTIELQSSQPSAVNAINVAQGNVFMATENRILVYSMSTKQQVKVLQGHNDFVTSLAVDDVWLLSASRDGTVRVWDVNLLECKRVVTAPGVRVLSTSRNGTAAPCVVAGTANGTVEIWRREDAIARY